MRTAFAIAIATVAYMAGPVGTQALPIAPAEVTTDAAEIVPVVYYRGHYYRDHHFRRYRYRRHHHHYHHRYYRHGRWHYY